MNLLFETRVDQSLLTDGIMLPTAVAKRLMAELGLSLSAGEHRTIQVIVDQIPYEVAIRNISNEELHETIKLCYTSASTIASALQSIFSYSFSLLHNDSTQQTDESVRIYSNDAGQLVFQCITHANLQNKQEFFRYLGTSESMAGYTRSYKLVFYKVFFSLMSKDGNLSVEQLINGFRDFYVARKASGKIVDVDVSPVVMNIETSSQQSIYKLILDNPFKAISAKGFVSQQEISGDTYFVLDRGLHRALTDEDVAIIKSRVEKMLKTYYARYNSEMIDSKLHTMFEKIFSETATAKTQPMAHHPLNAYFTNNIPKIFYCDGMVDSRKYLVQGSAGKGTWAAVPWICIFDRSITTTATKGVYIVYLLSKDSQTIYLTLNQGCKDIRDNHSKHETVSILRDRAMSIANQIDVHGVFSRDEIELGDDLSEFGQLYEAGTIFYKAYHAGAVPDEEELRDDLQAMLAIYGNYVLSLSSNGRGDDRPLHEVDGEPVITAKEKIERIKAYIAAKGFSYTEGLIENFYLCLKTKPFVILAGTSGTGKTRLAKLFAEACGATTDNGRYKMVAVRPDWSDSSDLFGHVNLNGKFVPGAILDFVKQAENNAARPYFLCLDEMNLARVEYYMSDLLSIIETRDMVNGSIKSEHILEGDFYGTDQDAVEKYGIVSFPENLYIIGTVNMDETTFPFSRKVLDRANTIEFSYVDLSITQVDDALQQIMPLEVDNSFLKTEYLLLTQCADDVDKAADISMKLQEMNKVLHCANAQVGYRVRDEIVFYLLNNLHAELLKEQDAMDNEIMQKILPRLQGSSNSVKEMLCELFKICAGNYEGNQPEADDLGSRMLKAAKEPQCKYPQSAQKIATMVRRYEEDGFTSYWF